MKWLTLEQIKAQLRIEPNFTADDKLLEMYGSSAENTVLKYMNRTYYDMIESYGGIPDDVLHATLMLVDESYQHRSPASTQNMYYVLYGFDAKIKPYMRLASPAGDDEIQTVTLGSDVKIEFTAGLPDGLKLADVDFSGKVINADEKDKSLSFDKAVCIALEGGESYVVLVDSEPLGVGTLLLKLTVLIPDTDYPTGTRKQIVNINPHIQVVG